MKILALDTASAQCSAALLLHDQLLLRSVATARGHAQLLLPMIDALLAEAGTTLRHLDGIAFGRGPGSFTGVRVAASVTQGLALGADLPIRPVSDLRALAQQARRRANPGNGPAVILACMDARMGEVYWATYQAGENQLLEEALPERVGSPASLLAAVGKRPLLAIGMGLAAHVQISAQLGMDEQCCFADAEPHAHDVVTLAQIDLASGEPWLDATAAQPVYVRDEVVKTQG
ncbi:MAG: tRNA (adenosine(37)-N6)-threonylcarbamoyltransferase complex dimerization subunit type 1 TsaB [Pseudomonadota bacterium]